MNYYLKRKGKYLTKTKDYVSVAELDKAWGFDLYLTASQTSMKLGGDFEICHVLHILLEFMRKDNDVVEILRLGNDEKRAKIYEQANEIISLTAANKALLKKLKIEYKEKESS